MKKFIEKFKSLDAGVISRTFLFTVAYINQIITILGFQTYAASMTYQIISLTCTLIVSCICAWKNNNFTHLAQVAGKLFTALKDKKLTEDEIKDLLDKANETIEK